MSTSTKQGTSRPEFVGHLAASEPRRWHAAAVFPDRVPAREPPHFPRFVPTLVWFAIVCANLGQTVAAFRTDQVGGAAEEATADRGSQLLPDLDYSDSGADPGRQVPPLAWQGRTHDQLVQIGNEVSAGMLWRDGKLPDAWDRLAALLKAGIRGATAGSEPGRRPRILIHIDKGSDQQATRHFIDSLKQFDIAYAQAAGEPRSGLPSQASVPASSDRGDHAELPPGVQAVWDLDKAFRQRTSARERVCLNGLWRWQPAQEVTDAAPADRWGYVKVPGFWPGDANYLQEDTQTVYRHPQWANTDLRSTTVAWYQRELTIPENWSGRRITLSAEYVNSLAIVYVDGTNVGELRFPGGTVELTGVCRPGNRHVLSLCMLALPLKSVMLSYTDTNAAKEVRGSVERRGLCGDVYLEGLPASARISDVKLDTSVRNGEFTCHAALDRLAADRSYALRVRISEDGRDVRQFTSRPFTATDLRRGRITVTEKWAPERLWDLHTPQHQFLVQVSLMEASGTILDVYYPVRCGFREFTIDGRDFYLNGSRLYLSAVPLDNAQVGARTASYEGARDTLQRLKSFGINFVYTHNYGCQPGSHVSFEEILRAADDVGMLVALSQPHFADYEWQAGNAGNANRSTESRGAGAQDEDNGYARHAEFYVHVAQNHPSVVAYAMSHNATGYDEDMNPDLIDGLRDPRQDNWSRNNAGKALRAEAIVKALDPSRIVYHHSSGNLGSMHTVNFYTNFVPVQEMSDWLEHWAVHGVKPLFFCEYGVPFSWDWTMYRGWYQGERSFGSAKVPWEFCLAEWNAQFLGDRAYRISEREKQNLRFEARQFREGKLWHRWDYPYAVGSREFEEREEVFARYLAQNWRAHRTWGLSANSPWEYDVFWRLRDGAGTERREFPVRWDQLQRPGFSPDYTQRRQGLMGTDYEPSDWTPTAAARALIRNNQPLLAYIAGKPASFTSQDHNVVPGETVEKQLVVINNSRLTVSGDCSWSLQLPQPVTGRTTVTVKTGDQARVPLGFDLPATLAPGTYEVRATVRFDNGETQSDSFAIHVLPGPAEVDARPRIAVFDPRGETSRLLEAIRVPFQSVDVDADLSPYDVLVVGKKALAPEGPGPNVERVRNGLKVIVFEQTAGVLESRFGFRVAEYGLRQVFPRVPDHPILAGLDGDHLRDWRGEATLLPPRLDYRLRPRYGPTVQWCGIDVPRAWRCGCRGNVASVLIEKPARGDFLPVVDGGYGLQYSPLVEYREGQGLVLFCQLDVTGRTESDPAADHLVRNLLRYVAAFQPQPQRRALYAGDPAGKNHLEATGLSLDAYTRERLSADHVLIVGPGGGTSLVSDAAAIDVWLASGGHLLALGLDAADAEVFLAARVALRKEEHIAAFFEPFSRRSLFAGIGPADVHNRDPRQIPLVVETAAVVGNGILAQAEQANLVFCQLVPWQFEHQKQMNLKRTFRSASRLVARLAANMGVAGSTPLLERFRSPVQPASGEQRWRSGLYLDMPEEWDDPYRFFRW